MGEPTYDSDYAWNNLLDGTLPKQRQVPVYSNINSLLAETFKIYNHEVVSLNISLESAVPLKQRDGFAGILAVMHNLHCLVLTLSLSD